MALIQANFQSAYLKRAVPFNAILPIDRMSAGFEPCSRPLKTLYLLHGYTGSCMNWFWELPLGELAAKYGIAIIMPDAENHFYVDDMKRLDLYGAYIGRELIEFTRKVFPLSSKRVDTYIGGISMGGYGALRNGLKYSDVFGHILGISPANIISALASSEEEPNEVGATRGYYESVFGNLDTATASDLDLFWLSSKMAKEGTRFPEIYFACGYNDRLVFENRRFHEHLDHLGVVHIFEEGPGTHDFAYFGPHLQRGLDTFVKDRPKALPNTFWMEDAK